MATTNCYHHDDEIIVPMTNGYHDKETMATANGYHRDHVREGRYGPEYFIHFHHVDEYKDYTVPGNINHYFYHTQFEIVEKVGKGEKWLDVGCGPIVLPGVFASRNFNEILFADYSEEARGTIRDWWHCKSEMDILPTLQIYAPLEGKDVTGEQMQGRLRQKIKDVLYCDFFQPGILGGQDLAKYCPVDVVHTAYALETACNSYDDYCRALAGIVRMIKPGGYFSQMLALETSYYNINGVLYPMNTSISLENALEAVENCGLEVIYRKEYWIEKKVNDSDEKGHLAIVAQKKR